MIRERVSILIAIVAVAFASVVFFSTAARALITPYTEPESPAAPAEEARAVSALQSNAAPVELIIPKIGVDAKIDPVGVGQSGNMAVPRNYVDVGWYKYGTLPGHTGSAVIDGHLDNGFGLDAVFKHLSDLTPGDTFSVITADGSTLSFIVEEAASYPLSEVPLARLFNQTGGAYLALITCEGEWSDASKSYNERRVVFARLQ